MFWKPWEISSLLETPGPAPESRTHSSLSRTSSAIALRRRGPASFREMFSLMDSYSGVESSMAWTTLLHSWLVWADDAPLSRFRKIQSLNIRPYEFLARAGIDPARVLKKWKCLKALTGASTSQRSFS
jgi:hypothetical protein